MPRLSPAIKAAVACVVPLLACSTYYTLERLQNAGPFLYFAASVALPVLLLGGAGSCSLPRYHLVLATVGLSPNGDQVSHLLLKARAHATSKNFSRRW